MLLEDPKRDLDTQHREPARRTRGALAKRRSSLAVNLATLLFTIVFSYIAIRGVNLRLAWHALRRSDYWWLIPALIAFAFGTFARGLRWRSLFAHGRRPSRFATMNAMMIGYLYNNILPTRAGEVARIVVLKQRTTSPSVEITGTVALERLYDVVAVLAIFFVAEPWLPHVSWFGTAAIVAAALAVAIAAVVAALALYGNRPLRLLLRPFRHLPFLNEGLTERVIAELTHGLSGLRNRRIAGEAFLWTVASWLSSVLCAYFITIGFHLQLSFAASLLVMVAIGLSMILPSPPAAVGVFEGATLVALKAYDVPHSQALSFALVLHLVNFLPYIAVGAILLRYNARQAKRTS